jgi:1-acyl-sn-glycerol-3-phosphate acyltransferase
VLLPPEPRRQCRCSTPSRPSWPPSTALCARIATTGDDWRYYPHDPLARRLHGVIADRLLAGQILLRGRRHLATIASRPVVLVANHLSYADANLVEVALERHGGTALADRLTVIAGPKVFSNRTRRFSSLCFATIKTPQTSGRASEEAVMSPREVARAARQAIDLALERLRQGGALLVFGEGTRSRAAAMQPLVPGVTRYVDCQGAWVLPVAVTGTEALFPIGEEAFRPVQLVMRMGPPFEAEALDAFAHGNRRLMSDAIGLAIAELLPPAYRGVYGRPAGDLAAAHHVLQSVRRLPPSAP